MKKNRALLITLIATDLILLLTFLVLWKWPEWDYFGYICFTPGPALWKIANHIPLHILPLVNILFYLIFVITKRRGKIYSTVHIWIFRAITFLSILPWLIMLIMGIVGLLSFFISPGKIGG